MSKIKTLLISTLTLLFTVNQAFAFSDVSANHTNFDAIDWLSERGVDGENFYPRRQVSLAEFLKMGYLALGITAEDLGSDGSSRFVDVPAEAWYAPFAAEADKYGVLDGVRGNRLEASRRLTKAEAVKLGLKLFGVTISPSERGEEFGFADLRESHRLAPYVFRGLKIGVIDPVSDEQFGTTEKFSRGDAAELFWRLDDYIQFGGNTTITIQGHGSSIPGIQLMDIIWDSVEDKFLFEENIDEEKMLNAAIEGMIESLDDPYSTFMLPDTAESFDQNLSGELEGIGVYLSKDEESGQITVVAPIKNSPADEAGVLAGDKIVSVDNWRVEDDINEVVRHIKGPSGSSVEITVDRNGVQKKFTITRAKISLNTVELDWQNGIAVISVSQFSSSTVDEFEAAAAEILEKNASGIVLDLRNNPGGLVNTAVDMLGYFLEEGAVLTRARYRDGSETVYASRGEAELAGKKVAVLINEGSASASEIVASALQDHSVATIFGQTSYGKGTVQEISFFTNGTSLKLTVANWFSPLDQPINKHGVDPQIETVDNPDTQADEALDRVLRWF